MEVAVNEADGQIEMIKKNKKKRKQVAKDFPKDWMLIGEPVYQAHVKQKKSVTKEENNDPLAKKKRNRSRIGTTNETDDPDQKFLNDLHNNKIKKKPKTLSRPLENMDIEKPFDIQGGISQRIDSNDRTQEYQKSIDEFNESVMNPKNLEKESVFPMDKFLLTYTNNINRTTESVEGEIIKNISEQIDKKTMEDTQLKKSGPVERKFKRPVAKAKKIQLANAGEVPDSVAPKELTQEEKIYEAAKQMFFSEDSDYESFKKSIQEYEMYLEIINDEETTKVFKDSLKHIIINNGQKASINLPEIDVDYFDKYLIQSHGEQFGHRECVKGQKCIGMIFSVLWPHNLEASVPKNSFILREFLLPDEEKTWLESGGLIFPAIQKECILCNQFYGTYRFYRNCWSDEESYEILQDYCVKINDKGGYNPEYCLEPCVNNMTKNNSSKTNKRENKFFGISKPFLRFSFANYVYRKKDIRFYKKDGSSEVLSTKCFEQLPKIIWRPAANFQ